MPRYEVGAPGTRSICGLLFEPPCPFSPNRRRTLTCAHYMLGVVFARFMLSLHVSLLCNLLPQLGTNGLGHGHAAGVSGGVGAEGSSTCGRLTAFSKGKTSGVVTEVQQSPITSMSMVVLDSAHGI